MGLFSRKRASTLTEELTQRVWDGNARIKQLEDRLDASLDELAKRYRRAEQSEARFERKKADKEDCDDCPEEVEHPAFTALKNRQNKSMGG